ncbi:MAG: hypothetical protein IJS09_06395 [Treponema sp.]|nr:hypothetical protein [Treponema sp.]
MILILSLSLSLSSCMTMADYNYARIDSNLASGNYAAVSAELDEKKSTIYGIHDEVLVALDAGLVAHYDRDTDKSNELLSKAERLIDAYFSTSISQSVTSMVTNDFVQDYAGEDFEDLYTNLFMALNYIEAELYEDAMVEVRRFDNKLKKLRAKYEEIIQAVENDDENSKIKRVSIQFYNSALAHYVSMLLNRVEGDYDNVRIDAKLLEEAFNMQPSLYDFAVPSSIVAEKAARRADCRLNVLAFSGFAPVKKEEAVRAYSWRGTVWYKLALPKMEKRPSAITSIVVKAINKQTGESFSQTLEQIESLENISVDTFQQKYSVLFTKALLRSIAKTAANTTMNTIARRSKDATVSTVFSVLDFATKISNEFTERADVRTCRFFPAKASVTGMNVPAGDYTVSVEFMAGSHVACTETKELSVRAGKLNFVEAACLR